MTITAVMIDSREADWVKKLTFNGIPTSVVALDHGDLMAACDDGTMILIERKTPDDFLNSLRDERLFPQLATLRSVTPWAYLVVTGELARGANDKVITDRGETGWSWHAVQGALISIQEMGVFTTFSGGDMDYERCVIRLGNRERKPELLLKRPPVAPRILSIQENVIASLPGIGTERLQAVMSYTGNSAVWALIALTDPESVIPGVPNSTKLKIRNTLGLAEGTQLILYTNENGQEILENVRLKANENI